MKNKKEASNSRCASVTFHVHVNVCLSRTATYGCVTLDKVLNLSVFILPVWRIEIMIIIISPRAVECEEIN